MPPRRHSAMFGDVLIVTTKGRGKWYQDVVGRSQGCCQHLKMHGTVPTSKNYPAPDVNSPDYTLILYRHMEKKRLQDSITARFHCFLKYLFIDFIYLFIYFLALPHSMLDLSSPTRDRTLAPCSGSTES